MQVALLSAAAVADAEAGAGAPAGATAAPRPPRLRSIASDSFAGQALVKKQGARMGAEMWAWRCQSAVANALRPGARAAGQYVCIEMVAWIAERAGLPVGESVTQPAVIAALAALAARRAGELAGARGAELDPRDPRVVELVYACLLYTSPSPRDS